MIDANGPDGFHMTQLIAAKLAPIVERAMLETVTDVGQLSRDERKALDKAVRQGHLIKGKGGPYPILKTIYALPGYDFHTARLNGMVEVVRAMSKDRARGLQSIADGVKWQQATDFPYAPLVRADRLTGSQEE